MRLLFGVAAFILFETVRRCVTEPDVLSTPTLVIASVGLVVNLIASLSLASVAKTSLNVRGVYLEVIGDLKGSVAAF